MHARFAPSRPMRFADALGFALRYDGRRRIHDADYAMGRITADRLVRHLQEAGFVLMNAPPGAAPTTGHMPPPVQPGHRSDD